MKILIIEDEQLNAERLKLLIGELLPDGKIMNTLQSVAESVEWFSENAEPDVVFLDIHLADGSAFSIFDKVQVKCPIIFTTAYDEYALKAFEVNSIDYLLKPIDRNNFLRAIDKLKNIFQHHPVDNSELINKLSQAIYEYRPVYKSSLLVSMGDKFIPLPVKEIAFFYVENKMIHVVQNNDKKYLINSTLDDIWKQLDPAWFYRANRQFIVAKWSVKEISLWFGNRVVVNLKLPTPERIVISRTHVQEFKKWVIE
ncbi:LytTR family DNA-binding domain-containing protein [Bacteroidales bacterium OttesenSCG-928-B11]|nr:LytTR family DNA-binding domain-containing protein [Bacteroidales bacterium OttesenSCG-928-C03]MDL2313148.1 LytTR family DNA-binding domain-containing protein [Bacteroidales bacterium OttesenSCG-928-B11]MDL2325548.1 LytTR family DNA-binding domain-containing protein [Bacteroidales bacterium OttesenSCG-928-A14]